MKHESKTQQEAFRMEKARLNLSNREAAAIVGVTKQMINQYEQDGRTKLARNHKAFIPLCNLYCLDPVEIGKMIDKQKDEERKKYGEMVTPARLVTA